MTEEVDEADAQGMKMDEETKNEIDDDDDEDDAAAPSVAEIMIANKPPKRAP